MEAIRAGTVAEVHLARGLRSRLPELVAAADASNVRIREVDTSQLDERCEEVRHQGVIGLGPPYHYFDMDELPLGEPPLLVALDEISDPHNLGAIVRSAVVFGADGIVIPKHRAATVTPAVVRASAGATEHAKIAMVTNLQKALVKLAEEGFEIVGLAADSVDRLDQLTPGVGRVLVVGSEGKGLRRMVAARCHRLVAIDQIGPLDSLNASVAAAIALYEVSRRRYESAP